MDGWMYGCMDVANTDASEHTLPTRCVALHACAQFHSFTDRQQTAFYLLRRWSGEDGSHQFLDVLVLLSIEARVDTSSPCGLEAIHLVGDVVDGVLQIASEKQCEKVRRRCRKRWWGVREGPQQKQRDQGEHQRETSWLTRTMKIEQCKKDSLALETRTSTRIIKRTFI